MVILTFLLLPILTLTALLCAQVGLTVATKMELQVVADKATYAAAAQQARDLDQIALLNWKIRQELIAQRTDFGRSQQKDDGEGKTRLASRQQRIDRLREEMSGVLQQGYQTACAAALDVVEQLAPTARMIPLSGHAVVRTDGAASVCQSDDRLFTFGDDRYREDQWPTLGYSFPEGGETFFDPGSVGHGDGELLQYRTKPLGNNQQVAFALRLDAPVMGNWLAPIWPEIVDDPALVPTASAAAQPVGGDIEASAWLDGADETVWHEQYAAQRYHPTLVPMVRLQDRAAGYAGLEWYDDTTDTWNTDEEQYVH